MKTKLVVGCSCLCTVGCNHCLIDPSFLADTFRDLRSQNLTVFQRVKNAKLILWH